MSAVETTTKWADDNSIPRTTSKSLYKLDKQGRIIQNEKVDPDETDSMFNSRSMLTKKYNRRGQLLSQTGGSDKTEYRYHRGLKTWELYYKYENDRWQLQRIFRYKYNFRHKLPLERTSRKGFYENVHNNLLRFIAIMTERVDARLVWTYEK